MTTTDPHPAVWVVVCGNYEPAEMAELYDNEPAVQEHADALGGMWHIERWPVHGACTLTRRNT